MGEGGKGCQGYEEKYLSVTKVDRWVGGGGGDEEALLMEMGRR